MKMLVKTLRAALLVLAAAMFTVSAFALYNISAAAEVTVYLDAVSGNDGSSGISADKALKTYNAAINAVGKTGGRIVLVGNYSFPSDYTEPEHKGTVVITSNDGTKDYGGILAFPSASETVYRMSGPVVFRELKMVFSGWTIFAADFNPIEFGEGLNMVGGASYVFAVGGYQAPESTALSAGLDSSITIKSGSFYKVCGFTRTKGAGSCTFTGTSHITVSGGSIGEIYGASLYNHASGNTRITVTGGSISVLNAGGDVTRRIDGSAKITLSGGNIGKININNVIGGSELTLEGAAYGSIDINYYNDTLQTSAEKAGCVNTVRCNTRLYSAQQVNRLIELFDVTDFYAQIFVRDGGTGDGSREDAPCGSLAGAYSLLSSGGGTITVVGSAVSDLSSGDTAINGGIKLNGGKLSFPSGTDITFGTDISFENSEIAAQGGAVIKADGCSVSISAGCSGISLIAVNGAKIYIYNGSFGTVTANASQVSVFGGEIGKLLYLAGSKENCAISQNGGNISEIAPGGTVCGSVRIDLGGGTAGKLTAAASGGDLTVFAAGTQTGSVDASELKAECASLLVYAKGTDKKAFAAAEGSFGKVSEAAYAYVAEGGSGDGSTYICPLGSIEKAAKALTDGGYIVICGRYTVPSSFTIPQQGGEITVTSKDFSRDYRDTGAAVALDGSITCGGETTFENVTFEAPSAQVIYADGNPLTIGDGVSTLLTNANTSYIGIAGGNSGGFMPHSMSVTVNSGDWGALRGGSTSASDIGNRIDISITVNGGVFHQYVAAGSRGLANGKISLTVNGGVFYQGIYAVYETNTESYTATYDAVFNINGGEIYGIIAPAKMKTTEMHGSFTVNISGGEFGHLTDIWGTEKFAGDMTSTLNIESTFDPQAEVTGEVSFTNYLRRGEDPNMFFYNGFYYYIATGNTSVALLKTANIGDLKTASGYTILKPAVGQNLWSPEIHYFSEAEVGAENAGWYMFISYDDGTTANQRQHVVKCLDGDNLLSTWGNPVTGEPNVPQKIVITNEEHANVDTLCGGTSVIRINGTAYLTFVSEVGRGTPDFYQTINICTFENPWTYNGPATTICVPEYSWEMHGYTGSGDKWWPKVVEGAAAVYGENGEIYLMYTGSGYWTVYYQLGYMKYNGGDPLDAKSWEKNPESIFSLSDTLNGCGHGSYFTDARGTMWVAYHAYLGKDTSSKRYTFAEPIYVDGTGVSIGDRSGHPASLDTVYTMSINPTPFADKISGFGSTVTAGSTDTVTAPVPEPAQPSGSVTVVIIVCAVCAAVAAAAAVISAAVYRKRKGNAQNK